MNHHGTIHAVERAADRPASAERQAWIDGARGFAIVLVVFGHVLRGLHESNLLGEAAWFQRVDQAIYALHVPLLIVVSGFLFVPKAGVAATIQRSARHLLVPLIIWSYIAVAFRVVLAGYTNRPAPSISEIVLYPFLLTDVYWFLWVLLVVQIVASLDPRGPLSSLNLAVMSVAAILIMQFAGLPAGVLLLTSPIYYFPLFAIGILLRRAAATGEALPLGLGTGALLLGSAELIALTRPLEGLPFQLVQCVAAIGAMGVFYGLRKYTPPLLVYLGVQSMVIFVSHVFVTAGTRIVLVKFFAIENMYIHMIAGTLLGLAAPLVLYVILLRTRSLAYFGLRPVAAS